MVSVPKRSVLRYVLPIVPFWLASLSFLCRLWNLATQNSQLTNSSIYWLYPSLKNDSKKYLQLELTVVTMCVRHRLYSRKLRLSFSSVRSFSF